MRCMRRYVEANKERMKKSVTRSIAVGVTVLSCTPFIYLACAIRAFRQDSTRIDPCFEGLVDCLESPVARPLELLLRANGVAVDNLSCVKYEKGLVETRSAVTNQIRRDQGRYDDSFDSFHRTSDTVEAQNFRYHLHESR